MRGSVAADFMVFHNFSKNQRYWGIAQNIRGEWKSPAMRFPLYAAVSYTNRAKFKNELEATAIDPLTTPQSFPYTNRARIRHTVISLGIKPYFKGAWDAENGYNIYGTAGLGVLMGQVHNTQSTPINTTLYHVPVRRGTKHFSRLTLDLGIGAEWPVGGDLFLYGEGKTYIPVSTYPSDYLLNSHYNPLTVYACIGARVLF